MKITKKEILGFIIILVVFGIFLEIAKARFEKIENGEIVVVSESYMDR